MLRNISNTNQPLLIINPLPLVLGSYCPLRISRHLPDRRQIRHDVFDDAIIRRKFPGRMNTTDLLFCELIQFWGGGELRCVREDLKSGGDVQCRR